MRIAKGLRNIIAKKVIREAIKTGKINIKCKQLFLKKIMLRIRLKDPLFKPITN
jgi:hypothetical protein